MEQESSLPFLAVLLPHGRKALIWSKKARPPFLCGLTDSTQPSARSAAASLAVGQTVNFADAPSPSLLKRLLKVEGGAAECQNSRRRRGPAGGGRSAGWPVRAAPARPACPATARRGSGPPTAAWPAPTRGRPPAGTCGKKGAVLRSQKNLPFPAVYPAGTCEKKGTVSRSQERLPFLACGDVREERHCFKIKKACLSLAGKPGRARRKALFQDRFPCGSHLRKVRLLDRHAAHEQVDVAARGGQARRDRPGIKHVLSVNSPVDVCNTCA